MSINNMCCYRKPKEQQAMARLFMVCDELGNTLADNLRESYAAHVAQLIANRQRDRVWLWDRSAAASDSGKAVEPAIPAFVERKQRRGHLQAYADLLKNGGGL